MSELNVKQILKQVQDDISGYYLKRVVYICHPELVSGSILLKEIRNK